MCEGERLKGRSNSRVEYEGGGAGGEEGRAMVRMERGTNLVHLVFVGPLYEKEPN